jgi:dipeptidyl-peptidase-4
MNSAKTLFIILVCLILISNVYGQLKQLSYEHVFARGRSQLLGRLPSVENWFDDTYYLSRIADRKSGIDKLFKVHAADGKTVLQIDYTEVNKLLPDGFESDMAEVYTEDYDQFVWNQDSDLYYFSLSQKHFCQLTADTQIEENPAFSPNGQYLAYTKNHNLYVLNLETGLEKQLTSDGSETVYNGYASWVYYEEILGRRSRYKAFWWSPDSKMLAFLRTDEENVPEFPLYNADGIRGELEIQRYPKAGDPVPVVNLAVVQIEDNQKFWCDVDTNPDHYIAWPFWTPDSKELFFQWMNRDQDHLKIYALDAQRGTIRQVYEERQDSWIEFFEDIYILDANKGFILRSDKDGWRHLYYYGMDGKLKNRITQGEWPVLDIALVDEENNRIFFHGWKNRSTERHLFSVNLNGNNLRQLTRESGTHRCKVSPGGLYYTDQFSSIRSPEKMMLVQSDGTIIREIGNRKLAILDEYQLGNIEIFTIPTNHSLELPALWILPADFDSLKKYPVIFYIYGGPGRSTVRNSFRRLSDHFRAQNGIITITVDHQGSGHFGKRGSAKMHRQLGKYEVEDLISAVKWLREQSFIDSTRIGITGGSYGGYVTCMALTSGAGYFTHGVANYSVTDWLLYDAVYSERYMDTPRQNPDGYKNSSAMTHAEKYNGKLLITHGTMDDNVHMQNTLQFIDKLQDLNKEFDLMLYPNSRHGVGRSKVNHLIRETLDYWFKNLLGTAVPE